MTARSANAIDAMVRVWREKIDADSAPRDLFEEMLEAALAALRQEPADSDHFEFTDECAMTLRPSSKDGYETLSIYEGDTALKIRLAPSAREALEMAVATRPSQPAAGSDAHQMAERLERYAKVQQQAALGSFSYEADVLRRAADFILAQAAKIKELKDE